MAPIVVLIGLPAAGKTSAGRRLARRLGAPFADSDALIEARTGRTVPEIFAEDGEAEFRALEQDVVIEALAGFDGVLALGGGAVLAPATRAALQESRVPVVHLVTDAVSALRFVNGGQGRPLLAGDPSARLAELERVRAPIYAEVSTASVRSGGRPLSLVISDLMAIVTTRSTSP